MHEWIGTYNLSCILFYLFNKLLHNTDLPCTSHCRKCFTNINSANPHHNPSEVILWPTPYYRCWNGGLRKLSLAPRSVYTSGSQSVVPTQAAFPSPRGVLEMQIFSPDKKVSTVWADSDPAVIWEALGHTYRIYGIYLNKSDHTYPIIRIMSDLVNTIASLHHTPSLLNQMVGEPGNLYF